MVDIYMYIGKLSPFPLFALYAFDNSPSSSDFSCTLRRHFGDAIQSMQGNCCPYHCKLGLERWMFKFTDGFKHSGLSHFAF